MDKWNPTTFYDVEHTQGQAGNVQRDTNQLNPGGNDNDLSRYEQRSVSVDQSPSNAEAMRQPVNVYPSDFGGYVLNPDSKENQTSELKYGSEDIVPRKQQTQASSNAYDLHGTKSSSINTEQQAHQNTTPLPDYEAKPILTHDKNVSFFGDSVTKEPHGVSRSTLDQDGLRRGSVSTLPSASDRYRRNSAHKRGIPISGTNNWSSDVNTSSQAKSAPTSANVPVFGSSSGSNNNNPLRDQNLSKPIQDVSTESSSSSTARKEEDRKSSIADMASAAVLAGGTAVAGVAAAASAALLGTTTTNNATTSNPTETTKSTYAETTTDHERMPSAWPSQTESDQSAGVHTNDRNYGESNMDKNRAFGESSLHDQNPSLYGREGECRHSDCDNRQAINNEHIIAQDFAGSHHKASPSDEDLAMGTNAICNSKMINAHNLDNEQQLGSTHDKINSNDAHGMKLGSASENDVTDPYLDDYMNYHSSEHGGDSLATTSGINSAGVTPKDMAQPKSHFATGGTAAAIGAASGLGAGAAIGAYHRQAINKGVLSAGSNKSDISHRIGSNPGSAGLEEHHYDTYNDLPSNTNALNDEAHMPTRAVTPPPSARSSQLYGVSNENPIDADTTSESNDISGIYRNDAQNTTSDMITKDHPRGYYDPNDVHDVYRTDAQNSTQNMIPSEIPTTSATSSANNNIADVYRTNAQDSDQNMIAADDPKITHPYSAQTPQSGTHQYESTSRASDEVMSSERNQMSEHHNHDDDVDKDDNDHTKSMLTGGGIAAAVGGGIAAAVSALSGKNQHETDDNLNNEDVVADHTQTTSFVPSANEPIIDDKHVVNNEDLSNDTALAGGAPQTNEHIIGDKQVVDSNDLGNDDTTKENSMAAAPIAAAAGSNQSNTSRSIGKVGQLHLDKLPLGVQIDQEPISKGRLDNNSFPQQMHDTKAQTQSSMPSQVQGQQKDNKGISSTVASAGVGAGVGAGAGAATTFKTSNKAENQHGTSTESFSSSRAIKDTIVPDVRHENDEIKNRHHNDFENTVDSTDPSFHDNQEHMQHQPRQSSFSQGFMTKAAAGTAAVASAFRRMSITGSHGGGSPSSPNDKHSTSTGSEHVRRLSDAEAFKKHTLATNNDDNTRDFSKNVSNSNKGSLATDSGTAGVTKNNVDDVATNTNYSNKEDLGVTNSGNDHLKYTGVQKDYARIPGVYSLNTSSGNPTNNGVYGESNFVKMNEQPQQKEDMPMRSTKDGLFSSGQQRRGSIQKTVGKLFRTHSGNQQPDHDGNITSLS